MNRKKIKEYIVNQKLDTENMMKDFTRLCIGNY